MSSWLDRLPLKSKVKASGLAIVAAASLLSVVPVAGQAGFAVAAAAYVGGLGLNLLSNALYDMAPATRPSQGDTEADQAAALATQIQEMADARRGLQSELLSLVSAAGTLPKIIDELEAAPSADELLILSLHGDVASLQSDPDDRNTDRLPVLADKLRRLVEVKYRQRQRALLPPLPQLLVGRESELTDIRSRLGTAAGDRPAMVILRGWPGVGKTTLANTLAYDADIISMFPDGVLWAPLGESPPTSELLSEWASSLEVPSADSGAGRSLETRMASLRGALECRRVLLLIDDAWTGDEAAPFKVGGPRCATVMTTRFNDVARGFASVPSEVLQLNQLSPQAGLDLMRRVEPLFADRFPAETEGLIADLEGLPLALRVAGGLLASHLDSGINPTRLLADLRQSSLLLQQKAPDDRFDPRTGTTPTIEMLLRRSTDSLGTEVRVRFALLAAFAPKPASFEMAAIAALWGDDDPSLSVRTLVDRGLLEYSSERYSIHALLVAHALTLA